MISLQSKKSSSLVYHYDLEFRVTFLIFQEDILASDLFVLLVELSMELVVDFLYIPLKRSKKGAFELVPIDLVMHNNFFCERFIRLVWICYRRTPYVCLEQQSASLPKIDVLRVEYLTPVDFDNKRRCQDCDPYFTLHPGFPKSVNVGVSVNLPVHLISVLNIGGSQNVLVAFNRSFSLKSGRIQYGCYETGWKFGETMDNNMAARQENKS
ncbi:hypothetical protein Tco_1393687 [Tanacetum coccineum]